jgi:DNA-directed RNA polymerase specialized sigma24 family protein
MIRRLTVRRMRRAFRALPERDRAIFGSFRFDGLDYAAVAELHGCSVIDIERSIARVMIALDRAASGTSQ